MKRQGCSEPTSFTVPAGASVAPARDDVSGHGLASTRQVAQVATGRGRVGMVRPEHLLPDVQGALEEGPGVGRFTLRPEQECQVVENGGGEAMVGS